MLETILAQPRDLTFTEADWQVLVRHWYPVAWSHEVVGRPVGVKLLDLALVLWRTPGGEVAVARDLCPHRGTPLSMGWTEGEAIVCPYHGFQYGPDGACRLIPAHPERPIPQRMRLTTFPAVERFGLVWTRLAGDMPADASLPEFEAWGDPAWQRITPPFVDIAGSAGRQMEGFLDVAHFAWVHAKTFADPDNREVPPYKVTPTERGVESHYWSSVPNWPKGQEKPTPEGFLWLRHFRVFPPFTALLTIHFPGEDRLSILNAASPVSARRTRLFVPIARNFGVDEPVEPVVAFNARIFSEDQAIVEHQKPEELPLDLTIEAHITADRMSVAYRQLLAGLGLGRGFTS
jgi:vanillate O-demethylase monooxygenase subunit